jgi:hypothetical protein
MNRAVPLILASVLLAPVAAFGQADVVPVWAMNSDGYGLNYDPLFVTARSDFYFFRGLQSTLIGEEMASMGDITGDGITDLVTGDRSNHRVRVYNGKTAYSWVLGQYPEFVGSNAIIGYHVGPPGTWYGYDVANVFDVNNDNCNDYIVGEPAVCGACSNPSPSPIGRVYVYSGRTHNLLIGIDNHDPNIGNFGWKVAGLGDVDGGGKPDFAVGAPEFGGKVFVFWGENLAFTGGTVTLGSLTAAQHQILTLPSCYPWPVASIGNFFGIGLAAGGDSNADGKPDSMLVGAPGATAQAGTEAGAAFAYTWMPANTADPCGGPATTQAGFVLRTFPGGAPMFFLGKAPCSYLGFELGLIGLSNHDTTEDFIIGAMGRAPYQDECFPSASYCTSPYQSGYAEAFSGADGSPLALTQGGTQAGDQARYGAYVAGDLDLDTDFTDCDLNMNTWSDVMVSSYRRKPYGLTPCPVSGCACSAICMCPASCSCPDTNTGSLNLYDGLYTSPVNWITGDFRVDATSNSFVPGGAIANGRRPEAVFGEALAWLARATETEEPADYPRLAVFEKTYVNEEKVPCQLIEGCSGTNPSGFLTLILSLFGHAAIPDPSTLGPDVPTIDWIPNPVASGRWTDGRLKVRLSSYAGYADYVKIIPSMSLTNVRIDPSGGTYQGSGPYLLVPPMHGNSPFYTLIPPGTTAAFPPFLPSPVALDMLPVDWLDISPHPSSAVWTSGFDISNGAMVNRYVSQTSPVHDYSLAHQRGTHLYLQVYEVYLEGAIVLTSNLLVLKCSPDG